MKLKKLAVKAAAIICAIAFILPAAATKAEAAEAKTLAEHEIGTVFKLEEDGTLYDWTLISHNYEGEGNQLLIRNSGIRYTNGQKFESIEKRYSGWDYYTKICKFAGSNIESYFNNDYITFFKPTIQNALINVDIDTYDSPVVVSSSSYTSPKDLVTTTKQNTKIFILSLYEVTGKASCTVSSSKSSGGVATGSYIPYFDDLSKVREENGNKTAFRDGNIHYARLDDEDNDSLILAYGYGACLSNSSWSNYSSTDALYYRPCIVLPADTYAIAGEEIVGEIIPTIDSVDVTDSWAKSSTVTVNATDAVFYAITNGENEVEPESGWQAENSFKVTENGNYYVWAKSQTGHTAHTLIEVTLVDYTSPIISAVDVPSAWAVSKTVKVSAADSQSGISGYTVTTENITPSAGAGWQASPKFTFISNGTYYVWAKDNAGNVSEGFGFEIIKIDTDKPVISEVIYPSDWVSSAKIKINAADALSEITEYAVSRDSTEPLTGWQTSPDFTLTANGAYYAWAKDKAGNIAYKYFYISSIDDTKPTVTSVNVPSAWGSSVSITINASDTGSGASLYAVTADNEAPKYGWQGKNIEITANGTYYAWVKDAVGNISAEGYRFEVGKVDSTKPVISSVDVPEDWAKSCKVTISASDEGGSGLSKYAITADYAAPDSGWQISASFTVTENGSYYAWVIDGAGNISVGYKFVVDHIDTSKPVITSVTMPEVWDKSCTITVNAFDAGSGAAMYAVSTNGSYSPTNGWQPDADFTFISNGTYYAWVKDLAGNISAEGYKFEIGKVDGTKPVINSVDIPADWAKSCTVTISASDEGGSGLSKYAITTAGTYPSSGWQQSGSFEINANGIYYAWAVDGAGNISAGYSFKISKIDTDKPVIDSVDIPADWAKSITVTINAVDTGSGAALYAINANGSYPPTSGWQPDADFTFTSNGTYYAWVKDVVGNVSAAGYKFKVDNVDGIEPVISSVDIPTDWAKSCEVTISASDDGGSGLSKYAITTSNDAPGSGWQQGSSFKVNSNGTYYAWVVDGAGNVSDGYELVVEHIDTSKPVIESVAIPTEWAKNITVTINATDAASGIAEYAVSRDSSEPLTDWQPSPDFILTANGAYYAWAKDEAGNTAYKYFSVSSIDDTKPTVTSVNVSSAWGSSVSITVNASDTGSGASLYAVTTTDEAPQDGWQGKNTEITANGTYYAWVKDAVGNISAEGYRFEVGKVDSTKPVISSVDVPEDWAKSCKVTISASDEGGSELSKYAITAENTEPRSGWQTSASFTVTENGSYYAWVIDGAGNISDGYELVVEHIDASKPVITSVTVPTDWAKSSTVTVNAVDSGSGVAMYAVNTNGSYSPTSGWQPDADFTFSSNGTYYAWVKDSAGNISAEGYMFEVGKVDGTKPVINSVDIPADWAESCTVTISASDAGGSGLSKYAITTANTAPDSGWQTSASFTVTENGSYYAWAIDGAGNISLGRGFKISKLDTEKPVISEVTYSSDWASSVQIKINASDALSGIVEYAVSRDDSEPLTGWQASPKFILNENGSYYAWAKDTVGNSSSAL